MIAIEDLVLKEGGHESREEGVCLLEAVAWVAGEPHSDHPVCVCPVLAEFGRSWNDTLNEADRNRLLKPLIPLFVGTAGSLDAARAAARAAAWARLAPVVAASQESAVAMLKRLCEMKEI
jgi:hypothetical protein